MQGSKWEEFEKGEEVVDPHSCGMADMRVLCIHVCLSISYVCMCVVGVLVC